MKKNNNNTQNHLNCNQNYVFFSTIILLSLVFLLTLLFSPYSHFGSSLVIPNTAKKTKAWREGENKSEKKIQKKTKYTCQIDAKYQGKFHILQRDSKSSLRTTIFYKWLASHSTENSPHVPMMISLLLLWTTDLFAMVDLKLCLVIGVCVWSWIRGWLQESSWALIMLHSLPERSLILMALAHQMHLSWLSSLCTYKHALLVKSLE